MSFYYVFKTFVTGLDNQNQVTEDVLYEIILVSGVSEIMTSLKQIKLDVTWTKIIAVAE